MRMFSLRRILTASLVLLATVPALLVLWMMSRAGTEAVEDLAGKILTQVAAVVQADTEAHVQQVHDVLDGLFPERIAGAEVERARSWLRNPAQFEAMAFALTRQSADVPVVHFANLRGEYFGLEKTADGASIGIRKPDGLGRMFFDAALPRRSRAAAGLRDPQLRAAHHALVCGRAVGQGPGVHAGAGLAHPQAADGEPVAAGVRRRRRRGRRVRRRPVPAAPGRRAAHPAHQLARRGFPGRREGAAGGQFRRRFPLHRKRRQVPAHQPGGEREPRDPRRLRGAAGHVGAPQR